MGKERGKLVGTVILRGMTVMSRIIVCVVFILKIKRNNSPSDRNCYENGTASASHCLVSIGALRSTKASEG